MVSQIVNYLLTLAFALLMVFSFTKDREAYKKPWVKTAVLFLIIVTGVGGILNIYFSNEQHEADQAQIVSLQASVETANQNQKDNTKQFVEAFGQLSQKVSDLQTQVDNADLKKEAAQLKEKLEATQKALVSPKATLTFSFARSNIDSPVLRQVTLPVKENVVHVEFTVVNRTETPALDGALTIIICDACKFVSEPHQFRKLAGQVDTRRTYDFVRILPKTELSTMSADIQVPPNANSMAFTVNYRCTNCIIPDPNANSGLVFLDRSK